jgi:hypothetical protein
MANDVKKTDVSPQVVSSEASAVDRPAPGTHRSLPWWIPYVYLLRVPILTALIGLIALPAFGPFSTGLSGLFDLGDAGPRWSILGMALVSLAAFTTSSTLLATSWCTIYNAPERFDVARIPLVKFPIRWPQRVAFGTLALPTIYRATLISSSESGVSTVVLLAGATVGLGATVLTVLWTNWTTAWLSVDVNRPAPRTRVGRRLKQVIGWLAEGGKGGDGFLEMGTRKIRDGHVLAWVAWSESFGLYVIIGVSKYTRLGYPTYVSTLACVLLLALMLCWMAAGVAFFVDRYRVPILAPLLLLPFVTSACPSADHFYRTFTDSHGYSPPPADVMNVNKNPVIVVATTGGGIQASAWTARVLVGIDRALQPEFGDTFSGSIRMISSVSGGGVGALHFVDKYRNGRFDPSDGPVVVKQADASSLDEVAWGLTYPDFWRAFFPMPIRGVQIDRGQALEWAWAAHDPAVRASLATWRDDVASGNRPANIFNATIVDTGEPLLIGTTRVGWDADAGLRNFEDLYPGFNIQAATAARLSATFTYASPAVRSDRPGRDVHVVDGGYYDDYGMLSAMAWIHDGARDSGVVRHVLLIQIHDAPANVERTPDSWHGTFYQVWAPLETMLNVRRAGQRSHNDNELALLMTKLCAVDGVRLDTATFEFGGTNAPLSWHLTGLDKKRLDDEWAVTSTGAAIDAVRKFLRTEELRTTTPDQYDAAVGCRR